MPTDPTSEFSSSAATAAVTGAPGAPPASGIRPGDNSFFGHPRGLATLFFTEFWERFSYYGMRGLLILFMTATLTDGGLGMSAEKAGAIYGLYTAFVYLTALPGGWLADRVFGQRNAVLYGGIVIALGHFALAFESMSMFYAGLVLVVIGTGLLKPNISTMVAELYPEGGSRRDAGFSIFYMGINLGAFVAPLVLGWLRFRYGWHVAFAAAGVGMVLGLVQYLVGGRALGDAGRYRASADDTGSPRQRLLMAVGVGVGLVALLGLLRASGMVNITAEGLSTAGGTIIVLLSLLYFTYAFVAGGLSGPERSRLVVIAVLFVASAIFWAGFEQAGSSLNLFAERNTDLDLGTRVIPAEWLQSVNSFWIILLAPVFAGLWVSLGRSNREPTAPGKFVFGLLFMGLGFLVMVFAAQLSQNGVKVSPLWLVLTYLLHTIGELCLSPVGLSTVTKLAPYRMVGQMMGVWFMSVSLGNYIAGRTGGMFESLPLPQLFGNVAAIGIGAALLLALVVPITRRMIGDVK